MNKDLKSFLEGLKAGTQIHLICCDEKVVIIGKFSKFDGETIRLEIATIDGKTFPMGTNVDANKVCAWNIGGKSN